MSKTYLFIDDEAASKASVEPYAVEIMDASKGELEIESYAPTSIEAVLAYIVKAKPDGLLMDVAFAHALTPEKVQVSYDGVALAQQIRTQQTRRADGWGEFPLVRFSKANIISQYIGGDTTSDDLFDEKIDKPTTLTDPGPAVRKLLSLAIDYPRISNYLANEQSDESLASLLGCGADFLSRLDARALVGLRQPDAPAHVLSRFIIGSLLGRSGPIIDEALLAVRLGIDRDRSPDWPTVLDSLKSARYQGVFSQGYERWWMALVLDWWSERIDSERALFRLGAGERVQAIQRIGIAKLAPIVENADSPGTKVWNLCLKSKLPVDPAFGFPLLPELRQETWHDVDYLCLEEARRDPRNTRLGAAERTRLAKLRKGNA